MLARGRVLAEGDYAEVSRNPDVIAAYLGPSGAVDMTLAAGCSQVRRA